MIEGLGVDVVDVDRIARLVERWGERFLRKVFTDREIEYAVSRKNSHRHLAARFAVKEAVAKAVATGWQGGFRWKDVEVANDSKGKPSVLLAGAVASRLAGANVQVSISHAETVVVGMAVVERK